jgi:hypothetical protein
MTCSCLKKSNTIKTLSKERFEPYDFTSDMQKYWKDEHLQNINKEKKNKKVTFVTPDVSIPLINNQKPATPELQVTSGFGSQLARPAALLDQQLETPVTPTLIDPIFDGPALREAAKKPEKIKNIPGIETFTREDWINLWWILEWFKKNEAGPKEYNIQSLFELNDPELTRYLYNFLYWEKMSNKITNSNSKPSISIPVSLEPEQSLTEEWHAYYWHRAVVGRIYKLIK